MVTIFKSWWKNEYLKSTKYIICSIISKDDTI
jgi:hypothetical protein